MKFKIDKSKYSHKISDIQCILLENYSDINTDNYIIIDQRAYSRIINKDPLDIKTKVNIKLLQRRLSHNRLNNDRFEERFIKRKYMNRRNSGSIASRKRCNTCSRSKATGSSQ